MITFVSSILNCISSVKEKLLAIEKIIDSAAVPWSSEIRSIAHSCLHYSHPLVGAISSLIDDEPIQIVLQRPAYKIKDRKVNTIADVSIINKKLRVDLLFLCEKCFTHNIGMLATNNTLAKPRLMFLIG